jgi:oligoendopeptidase F
MKKFSSIIILTILITAFGCSQKQIQVQTQVESQPKQQARERAEIPEKYKWKLEDLYASDEAWNKAKDELVAQFDDITKYKGKLAESASELLACLEFESKISKEFGRLYSYAHMKSDQDKRDSNYLAMEQQMRQLSTDYNSKAAFITPEIAAMDKETIDRFIEREPGLKIYKMPLYDIQRTKAHTLSDKEEKILAQAGLMADGPYTIYGVFSNAEMPYPQIELSDGNTVTLTKAAYAQHRASPIRSDREAVFREFWGAFKKFKGTFGTQLYANVKKDMFYARTRKYESSLHSSLDSDNIPTEVYSALIENVTNNLDSFHRYLKLKKRMLGVEKLKYSDIYAPVVKGIDLKYTYEQAKELVLDAFKPLGDDYCSVVA